MSSGGVTPPARLGVVGGLSCCGSRPNADASGPISVGIRSDRQKHFDADSNPDDGLVLADTENILLDHVAARSVISVDITDEGCA